MTPPDDKTNLDVGSSSIKMFLERKEASFLRADKENASAMCRHTINFIKHLEQHLRARQEKPAIDWIALIPKLNQAIVTDEADLEKGGTKPAHLDLSWACSIAVKHGIDCACDFKPTLDIEAVTGQMIEKLKAFDYEDLFDGSDEVKIAIRDILENAVKEKE